MRRLTATALVSGMLVAFAPGVGAADQIARSGNTRYVTHFVFHPMSSIDIPGVGKAVALEAVGPTENLAGEKMLDKMMAKCAAVSIDSGGKKYIDGACALTDNDGDVVFSTFDTRDLDQSQPQMNCGTHTITGGTGKYAGITGREPFACNPMETPAGHPPGSFAIDIPHNTSWEIK
ncbi:MAG: hypothetical protein IRY87_08320 [Acetobacteraceae bacterium]|nr:hypothetical protein [Acetobacteraceae bacterium]